MSNKVLLYLGLGLIVVGLVKPNFNLDLSKPANTIVSIDVNKPDDHALLTLAQNLLDSIRKNKVSKEDCLRLANICFDISTLVSLDGSSEMIKNTEEIRQANRLSGLMLRMDMNKKYPGLAESMNLVMISYLGDDIVALNSDLRSKAVNVFQALAWAFIEGSK